MYRSAKLHCLVAGLAMLVICGCGRGKSESDNSVTQKEESSKKTNLLETSKRDSGKTAKANQNSKTAQTKSSDNSTKPKVNKNVSPIKELEDGKIAVADFPVPDDAERVTRELDMITYSVEALKPNTQFLIDKLVASGWESRGEQIVEPDLAYLQYQKGTGTINVSLVEDDRKNPPVHVVIHGDGLVFPDSDESEAFGGDMAEEDFNDSEFGATPTDFEGLALPKGIDSPMRMGSQFRKEMITSVESDLESMHEFFQKAAKENGWKVVAEEPGTKDVSSMRLSNQKGEMLVNLKKYGGEVEIKLAFRNPEMAKQHGFVPESGQSRIILGNASTANVTIILNDKTYDLKPEQGSQDPSDGVVVDLAPGKYRYTVKGEGREEEAEVVEVTEGGTWGLIVFPESGHMAEQMY